MILSEVTFIRKNETLEQMLQEVTSIYNKTLYFLRQLYFEKLKSNEKIELPSSKEIYSFITSTDEWKMATVDTYAKNSAYKLAIQNFFTYFKAMKSYRKNPSKFCGKPNIPKYVKGRFIPVILDKTRLGKRNVTQNQFRIPKSKFVVSFSKRFEKKDIRNISFNQAYGKIKMIITYEKKEKDIIINNSFVGIDVGINNLASITSNDKNFSYIVKGTPLKSMNQYYNKKKAQLQSQLEKCNKKKSSKKLEKLTNKRNLKLKDYLHNASKRIIDLCLKNDIGNIVIGHNKGWKQELNIGKRNNQNFVSIPFNTFIEQLQYKGKLSGISVIVTEESYTSKTDHFVKEPMYHLEKRQGKRIKRGLFKSSTRKILNADINGAIGIMRKVNAISDAQLMNLRDRGDVVSPLHLIIR